MADIRIGKMTLSESEWHCSAIRAQGSGGQNVNKVATAIHLRFPVRSSSLPSWIKEKILASRDHHLTADGTIIIKAQQYRSQEKNRQDAEDRLAEIIRKNSIITATRRPTKPSKAAKRRRVEGKKRKSETKKMRRKVE